MKLVQLEIVNFRGAPDGVYAFTQTSTGKPLDLALITGGPASGKTSLLEAIAAVPRFIGGYGPPPDPASLRRKGATSGAIAATWLLGEDEAARAKVNDAKLTTEVSLAQGPAPIFDPWVRELFAFSTDPDRAKMEFFPASRRMPPGPPSPRWAPSDFAEARYRLSHDARKYAGMRGALVDMAVDDALAATDRLAARGVLSRWDQPDSFARIKESVAALAPWLRFLGVLRRDGSPAVCFRREDGVEVELEDLSDGEQQAVLFSVVFDRIGLRRSIVLVDLPELFVSRGGHADFLRALGGLGGDNQIIAVTTSAELLAGASPQQIVRVGRPGA